MANQVHIGGRTRETITTRTYYVAALATLGIEPQPSHKHSVKFGCTDMAWDLPEEQDGMRPLEIIADYESGKLDARHGFAEAMLGLRAMESLIRIVKRSGYQCRLECIERTATAQRWALREGEEAHRIKSIAHHDLAIVAALVTHGCPIVSVTDNGKAATFHLGESLSDAPQAIRLRPICDALAAGGIGPTGCPNWPHESIMPLAMRWQIAGVMMYRVCKRAMNAAPVIIHQGDEKFGNNGRFAMHDQNASGETHDQIRRFYRRARR